MSKTRQWGGAEKEEWRDRCSGEREKEVREKDELKRLPSIWTFQMPFRGN